ncbi:MAG: hypothetical protein IMY85_02835 [Chloroflexi bacterium]|nr:hypothetical protein [Chloroflexota bacterium]
MANEGWKCWPPAGSSPAACLESGEDQLGSTCSLYLTFSPAQYLRLKVTISQGSTTSEMTRRLPYKSIAERWGYAKPWRGPQWLFPLAGGITEAAALLLNKPAPPTRDFIRIGMASYVSNTDRMKAELLPELAYPSLQSGLSLL